VRKLLQRTTFLRLARIFIAGSLPVSSHMHPSSVLRLVDVLRATLAEVEQKSGVPADDPSFVNLKSILLRRIADLEIEHMAEEAAPSAGSAPQPMEIGPEDTAARPDAD
jgi:hypothetical protein